MIEHLIRLTVPLKSMMEQAKSKLRSDSPVQQYDVIDIEIERSKITGESNLIILFKRIDDKTKTKA